MLNGSFWLFSVIVAVVAYLIGSVSFAVIVSRVAAQEDVRQHGSGNAGMTNILRTYGKKMAVMTAIGDFGKGIVAVLLGRMLFNLMGITVLDGGYIAGLFAVLGHMFPLFFGFKGGKGVLTSGGVMLVLNPLAMLGVLVVAVPFVFGIKIVSAASLLGFGLYPFVSLIVDLLRERPDTWYNFAFALLICGIGIYMHRENIRRLLAGTEYKFGQKKK